MNHIRRRDFLKTVGAGTLCALSGCTSGGKCTSEKGNVRKKMETMKLRPHHILDIVTDYGKGERFTPHPYGHSLHTVAEAITSDMSIQAELVIGADVVCQGCKHLQPDGSCTDVLGQLHPSPSKQSYNEVVDCLVLDYLQIGPGSVMTIREYLEAVNEKVPGIETVCTHPKEDRKERLAGLRAGLVRLGIREKA